MGEGVAMTWTHRKQEEQTDEAFARLLWQQCRASDAPEDEAGRFLDLAAFADELLDPDDRDRVAALLAADPDAAADVRAAMILRDPDRAPPEFDRIVARACAILPDAPAVGVVVALGPRQWYRRIVRDFVQWGSLAAGIALASWLGFAIGSDASLALSTPRQPSDASFLPELFDPAPGFLRDLGEGVRT
jgi:hypothetical protein